MSEQNLKPAVPQSVEKLLAGGNCICIGEYRGWKTDTLKYTSKKDGSQKELKMMNHHVEVGEGNALEGVKVTMFLPDDTKLEDVHSSFVKGERVAVVVSSLSEVNGVRKINARDGGIFKVSGVVGGLGKGEKIP
jgi:hypothetical protein